MAIFGQLDFDNHEAVHAFYNGDVNLKGFVVVHSTKLGPALGGCRCWKFDNEDVALSDALRLSRGVSYKNAMAGIPYGGGMAVIMADPQTEKTPEMFEEMGRVIDSLGGAYITAEDVGTDVDDMRCVARQTEYVNGIPRTSGYVGGDQSPRTAQSVIEGMKAAVKVALERDDLEGVSVAVQGVGNVGYQLCKQLNEAGAKLVVGDMMEERVTRVVDEFGAQGVKVDEILSVEADILAPCALGGLLTAATIPWLSMKIVAGAANNQLATDPDGERLYRGGILYAPDFVINAGGVISVSAEREDGADACEVDARIKAVGERTAEIFARSVAEERSTHAVASDMARAIIQAA